MPIHDWSQIDAGILHDFHQAWTVGIVDALNSSGLPPAFFALLERPAYRQVSGTLSVQCSGAQRPEKESGGIAVADAPHKAIWDTIRDEPFELPSDKPLTVAAYMAGDLTRAYVDPIAVGDPLPSLPIFLNDRTYIPAPLESTYASTWSSCPEPVREIVENPTA